MKELHLNWKRLINIETKLMVSKLRSYFHLIHTQCHLQRLSQMPFSQPSCILWLVSQFDGVASPLGIAPPFTISCVPLNLDPGYPTLLVQSDPYYNQDPDYNHPCYILVCTVNWYAFCTHFLIMSSPTVYITVSWSALSRTPIIFTKFS